jgi:putative DNA primase/helicase
MSNIIDFNSAPRQNEPRREVTAESIRARLHANPQAFVEWLFSGRAYCNKKEARIGDVYGTPGESLSIQLVGPQVGLWTDHATSQSGDLIGLYRAFRSYHGTDAFVLSLQELAKDYFGDAIEIIRPTFKYTAPQAEIEERKAKLGTKPREDTIQLGAPVAEFKYWDAHGNIYAAVKRFEPDGTRESKTFRPYTHLRGGKWGQGAPDPRLLYEWQKLGNGEVVFVEGEGKVDALAKLGIVATSAMQGANAPIDKTNWQPLAGRKVTVWPDNDAPGFEYADRVCARLTALGCDVWRITPPADAPEKWDAGDAVREGKDVHALIRAATPYKPAKQGRAASFQISELMNRKGPAWLAHARESLPSTGSQSGGESQAT